MNGDEPQHCPSREGRPSDRDAVPLVAGRAVAVIPARYDSTRFPGKALVSIAGQPMISRVVRQVLRASSIDEVFVATDDGRIGAVASAAGAKVVMTSSAHASGSDRVAEAVGSLDAEIVINVQGDQPLADPMALDGLVSSLRERVDVDVVTLATPVTDWAEFVRPDVVKVVVASDGNALYFSRAPVPFDLTSDGHRVPRAALKHIGIYGFRRAALLAFATWPKSCLEQLEGLEQLRLLECGVAVGVVMVDRDTPSIDRPRDVAVVERLLEEAVVETSGTPIETRAGE